MHLENSVKLDFKDVLIRPKRSTLTSRSEVDITREFKFLHSSEPYHGIPIIAANMDTTGTFEMASALGRHKMSTALHKHYTAKEYVDFFHKLENKSDAFYSLGIGEAHAALGPAWAMARATCSTISWLCFRKKRTRSPTSSPTR